MYKVTHPYYPLNTPQEYYAFKMLGKFNPTTHTIDVVSSSRIESSDHRRTYIPILDGLFPQTAMVYTPFGVVPPVNWRDQCYGSIQSIGSAPGGSGFVGETGEFTQYFDFGTPPSRECHLLQQPEPMIPIDVTEYRQPVDITCVGNYYNKDTGAVRYAECPSRFRNLGPGPGVGKTWFWEWYPDQIRTCLMERPDTFKDEWTYNYVFARGVGLICQWWGLRDKDNNIDGYMFQLKS